MNVKDILKELKAEGMDITLQGENLKISSNSNEIPKPLLEKIKANKPAILAYLQQATNTGTGHTEIHALAPRHVYALSSAQRRLWILSQFEQANSAYNLPAVYVLEGALNRPAFEKAFEQLIQRHEILRTVFKEDENDEIKQYVNAHQPFHIQYTDLRPATNATHVIKETIRVQASQVFNLEQGPLLRASLLQEEDTKYVFVYVMHHIITDGWSMGLLFRELLALYTANVNGKQHTLNPLRIQYKDYAHWQQEQLNNTSAKSHRQYWLNEFQGELPLFEMFPGKLRPAVKGYQGSMVNGMVNKTDTAALKALTHNAGGTLFIGLLAAVNTLLYRYSGQNDLVIGTSAAGRDHADLENQIGFYINTLPLRCKFSGSQSFNSLLDTVKTVTLGAFEHQVYPFDELVDDLKLPRDASRHPVFDIGIVLQNADINENRPAETSSDLRVKGFDGHDHSISKFDLTFTFKEAGEGLFISIEYNTSLYSARQAELMCTHLQELIHAIILEPGKQINQLNYITGSEREELVHTRNNSFEAIAQDKTLVAIFEEQVNRYPHQIALVYEDNYLTYDALNKQANVLSAYLKSNYAVVPEDTIAVKLNRGALPVIALLGIIKAGAAYMPLDPSYPEDRLRFLQEDSNCRLVMDESELEKFERVKHLYSDSNNSPIAQPENLAYLIYTSGSTGQPKGVMVEHKTIINTILSMQRIFDVTSSQRHLQFSSLSFDASVCEMFMCLLSGSALYIMPEHVKKDTLLAERYIEENKIDLAILTPVYLQLLDTEWLKSIKTLITAGDAAIMDDARRFSEHGTYYNAYGPTESSICASVYAFDKNKKYSHDTIPIGYPIANTQLYIVDSEMNLMPVGLSGEICIGGAGVARGYKNLPALTSEKFIANPFLKTGRLYKTGDLGRWLEDGTLEFISRKDDQVKIRGFRIELGEVENALRKLPSVKAAVVIAVGQKPSEKELAAYIVADADFNTSEAGFLLSKQLPAYMIPSAFILMDALPLNASGKVNKKLLPFPLENAIDSGAEYVAPGNETEAMLVEVWKEILGRPTIGLRDNFFEIGGNSIKIIKLSKALHKKLGRDVPVALLFQYTNIESLAEYLLQGAAVIEEEEFNEQDLINDLDKFNID